MKTLLLLLLFIPSIITAQSGLEGTWTAVAPEGEEPVASIKIHIKGDGSLVLEQEISDEEQSFTYVIKGTWQAAGDTIAIHMSEAEGHIGGQVLKDQDFTPSTFVGNFVLSNSSLSLALMDENGVSFTVELQRQQATSVRGSSWAEVKRKIRFEDR